MAKLEGWRRDASPLTSTFMSSNLLESVGTLLRQTNILPDSSSPRIVVAVSGGQDSCALLHALWTIRSELSLDITAAHFNHGFRGADADADAEFVGDLCRSLDIECIVEKQDVPSLSHRLHLSKQEAARRARHEFLNRVAQDVGAEYIALGHTRDDRVETALMNIIRGTGITGLMGLSVQSGNRIRPLLEVSRAETAAYCRENGIAFREDASNLSPAYTRNRVREELLPLLEQGFNPRVREAIQRLSDLAEQDSDFLDSAALSAYTSAVFATNKDSIVVQADSISSMHPALQRRVIRLAIERVRGTLYDVEAVSIQRILDAIVQPTGPRFQFTLPDGNITVEVIDNRLQISRIAPVIQFRRVDVTLDVPGEATIPEFGSRFVASAVNRADQSAGRRTTYTLTTDSRNLAPPFTIRNRRDGDRIRPLGLGGSRKVQDILVDRKVPAAERDRVPILCDSNGIVWIVGHVVDERTQTGPDAESLLQFEMIGLNES